MPIKITKEQKKILYVSVVVLLFFVLFWSFIYRPQSGKFLALKQELKEAENKIALILDLTNGEELTVAVKKLRTNLDKAFSQFPKGEEDVIRNLSDEANRLKIKVKNITASGTKMLDVSVQGRNLEELSISMNLSCEYRQIGEYLNILLNKFPILVKVNKLDIKGAGEGKPDLDVDLKLVAYLSKDN